MAASPPSGIAYKGSIPALPAAHRSQRLAQQSRPGLGGATPRLHRSDRTAKSRQDWPGRHTLLQDPPGLLRAHAIPREDIEDCLGDAFGQTGPPPTYVTAPGRIVAVGDIHGDIVKAAAALCAAGVLGEEDGLPIWTGGDTTVVQIGDVLDRGDSEIGSLMLLRALDQQAREEGGAVYMLNGNHESLNLCGNFRYVTAGGYKESAMVAGLRGHQLERLECQQQARRMLYAPGGMIAQQLALNPTVLIVNDTAFAHGGILPTHVQYGLEQINDDVSAWMRGTRNADGNLRKPPFLAMGDPSSVMWNRMFSQEKFKTPWERHHACGQLQKTLEMLQVRQMVVGHTPQVNGANCECDRRVWRVDVGMSRGVLNARPQVLEISKDAAGDTFTRLLMPGNGPLPRPAFWR